jgi:tRNAThr (cytosine32-N3)-methyltransferase
MTTSHSVSIMDSSSGETLLAKPVNGEISLIEEVSALTIQDPVQPLPPHRSHDPENNLKRVDPFQFGSRLLNQEDNVFEFNAWDHVETDDTYKEYAELQYAKQRESPVSDFDKSKLPFPCTVITCIMMIQK